MAEVDLTGFTRVLRGARRILPRISLERQAQLLITNDAEWGRVKRLPCRVLILDNYLREQRA